MRLHLLVDRIPWFGAHSGYEQLARYLPPLASRARALRSVTTLNQIRLGKLYARARGWTCREDWVYAAAELRFALDSLRTPADVRHILYGEGHHHYLEHWRKAPSKLVATLHHPPVQWCQWPRRLVENLRRLKSAIVLYRADLEAFESLVGPGRVRFIRHGIDTEFFSPPETPPDREVPRVLYAGQNGRNTEMLARVIPILAGRHPELRFDLLVRSTIRERFEGLARLAAHPAVRWHESLSDEALLELYRRSYLLLLPLDCCGASTAMVEALACGLPLVTTAVGGVPDYGGGSLYPVVANNDDDALVDLVERYLADTEWRNQVGASCRAFAETVLDWRSIAGEHLSAYRELTA